MRSLVRTLILLLALGASLQRASADDPPNALFIAVDDLRDWVGHLGGHPQAKTPNVDRLAERGVSFTQAYCSARGGTGTSCGRVPEAPEASPFTPSGYRFALNSIAGQRPSRAAVCVSVFLSQASTLLADGEASCRCATRPGLAGPPRVMLI